MNTNIFIPETIKVGFQNREDTYTKKLAYIIYYDQKGKLRKETSWQSWRNKNIPALDFKNEPISGFVLNKKVGDYVSDWNHRQAYVRVYDKRGFEFEITIENLLYILENVSSIKGKGLDGDFIYSWNNKNLILLPIDSPDYDKIRNFNKIIYNKTYIKGKELKLGATYRTKSNEELIYMGRFDYWDYDSINKGKYYFFALAINFGHSNKYYFKEYKNLSNKIIEVTSNECIKNYAETFDQLECSTSYSPFDESKNEYVKYTFEEFCEIFRRCRWCCFYVLKDNKYNKMAIDYCDNVVSNNERYNIWKSNDVNVNALKETFDKFQPTYKNEYLMNGKLYRKGKFKYE
jgi:hypothetical protein